jgi:DNA-binding SARP family transcriptional activator
MLSPNTVTVIVEPSRPAEIAGVIARAAEARPWRPRGAVGALTRDEAMAELWPDLDPSAAGANLRKAAYHARKRFGVDDVVVLDGASVQLLPGAEVVTDVARFERTAREALAHQDVERSRQATPLYTGELLPDDRYERWSEGRRAQLEDLYRELLVVGRLWGRLLTVDPTSEVAHRWVIRERLEAGDRAGAIRIRQFDEMRRLLRDELGVSPDPEPVALYEQALAAEALRHAAVQRHHQVVRVTARINGTADLGHPQLRVRSVSDRVGPNSTPTAPSHDRDVPRWAATVIVQLRLNGG